MQGVERVADLMSHACRQLGECRETLALDGFLGGTPVLSGVPEDDGVSDHFLDGTGTALGLWGFQMERNHVEAQEPVLRIKDLHFAAHGFAGLEEFVPLESAEAFIEGFAHALLAFEAEEGASLPVEVIDLAGWVGDDHAFVDGVKDGFKNPFSSESRWR